MNSKVFQLNKLLSELDGQGGYFIDFFSLGIQAGIIRLLPGEKDIIVVNEGMFLGRRRGQDISR